MIYIVFQGCGKSTLSKANKTFIDLDSSLMKINGKKNDNWFIPYCNIAIHLSNSGYDVFISAHKEVRDYLKNNNIDFCVIYPSLDLKHDWILKLKNRYDVSKLEVDLAAYKYAEQHYESAIEDLSKEKNTYEIKHMDYSLREIILYNDLKGGINNE